MEGFLLFKTVCIKTSNKNINLITKKDVEETIKSVKLSNFEKDKRVIGF